MSTITNSGFSVTTWGSFVQEAISLQIDADDKVQNCYQTVRRLFAEAEKMRAQNPHRAAINYQKAYQTAETVLRVYPKASCSLRAELLCEQAVAANRLGWPNATKLLCAEALKNEPKLERTLKADLHHVLGRAYEQLQDYSFSVYHYQKQFNLETDGDTKIYIAFDIIKALLKIKDYKKILDICRIIIPHVVDTLTAIKFYYYIALSAIELKKDYFNIYRLCQHIERLIISDPILISLFQNLHGVALLDDGKFEEAIKKFKLCLTNAALPENVRAAALGSIKKATAAASVLKDHSQPGEKLYHV